MVWIPTRLGWKWVMDSVVLGWDGVMNLVRLSRNCMMDWLRLIRNMMWLTRMRMMYLVRLARKGVVSNVSELSSRVSLIPGLGLVTAYK